MQKQYIGLSKKVLQYIIQKTKQDTSSKYVTEEQVNNLIVNAITGALEGSY